MPSRFTPVYALKTPGRTRHDKKWFSKLGTSKKLQVLDRIENDKTLVYNEQCRKNNARQRDEEDNLPVWVAKGFAPSVLPYKAGIGKCYKAYVVKTRSALFNELQKSIDILKRMGLPLKKKHNVFRYKLPTITLGQLGQESIPLDSDALIEYAYDADLVPNPRSHEKLERALNSRSFKRWHKARWNLVLAYNAMTTWNNLSKIERINTFTVKEMRNNRPPIKSKSY
jgi:hypothetical protein